LYDEVGQDSLSVVGVMCENANHLLPSTGDCSSWANAIDATYPVLADRDGTVCSAWEYPQGVTTVFVLDVGGVVASRHDTRDPTVLDLVREDVDNLLDP
jgi:hypothetical protein